MGKNDCKRKRRLGRPGGNEKSTGRGDTGNGVYGKRKGKAYSDADAKSYCDAVTYSNADAKSYCGAVTYSNTDTDSHTDSRAYCDSDGHDVTDSGADCDCGTYRNGKTGKVSFGCG